MMPLKESLNEEQIGWAARVCEDDRVLGEESSLNNKQKWARIREVFQADKATLFSDIDYLDWFIKDDPRTCEAAGFMADLRLQWLDRMMLVAWSPELHRYHILNKQWFVRLRERARMHVLSELVKRHGRLV